MDTDEVSKVCFSIDQIRENKGVEYIRGTQIWHYNNDRLIVPVVSGLKDYVCTLFHSIFINETDKETKGLLLKIPNDLESAKKTLQQLAQSSLSSKESNIYSLRERIIMEFIPDIAFINHDFKQFFELVNGVYVIDQRFTAYRKANHIQNG